MRRSGPARVFACWAIVIFVFVTVTVASPRPQNPANAANPGGNPERGKAVFDKCAACHAIDDTVGDGPSLKGVFGRKAGSREDYRYSPAMVRSGIVWSAETIDAYVTDPQGYIRGNRMSFAGIPDKAERDDLIAYLLQATAAKAP